jgi:hypothetical protein
MKIRLSALALTVLLLTPAIASAEQRPGRVELHGILGYSGFPDDGGFLHHFVAGGSGRILLTRRLAFEPEFLYMYRDETDRDLVFIPNVSLDLTSGDKSIVPYVVGGVGVLRHYERQPHFSFAGNARTFGAGVGAKLFINKR